MAHSPFL